MIEHASDCAHRTAPALVVATCDCGAIARMADAAIRQWLDGQGQEAPRLALRPGRPVSPETVREMLR